MITDGEDDDCGGDGGDADCGGDDGEADVFVGVPAVRALQDRDSRYLLNIV